MLVLSHYPSHQALLPPAGIGWAGGEVGPHLAMQPVRVPLPACTPALEYADQHQCLCRFAWQPCVCQAEWEARAWCGPQPHCFGAMVLVPLLVPVLLQVAAWQRPWWVPVDTKLSVSQQRVLVQ